MPTERPPCAARGFRRAGCAVALTLASAGALAQGGFAAYISPPRFELQLTAGQTSRQIVEIQHASPQKGAYRLYTNDWGFGPDHALGFSDTLTPESCRPWVAIERRDLDIEPGGRYRYRFEITPPPDTPPRECRFALMVEGRDAANVAGDLNFPVGGRVAVIVYAAVGGAAPQLSITGTRVATVEGRPTAVLEVRNTGNAHGRLDGFVSGTDATGARFELAPSDAPILPGETRSIGLTPVVDQGKPVPVLRFPLAVQGNLEWGKNRLPLDARFVP